MPLQQNCIIIISIINYHFHYHSNHNLIIVMWWWWWSKLRRHLFKAVTAAELVHVLVFLLASFFLVKKGTNQSPTNELKRETLFSFRSFKKKKEFKGTSREDLSSWQRSFLNSSFVFVNKGFFSRESSGPTLVTVHHKNRHRMLHCYQLNFSTVSLSYNISWFSIILYCFAQFSINIAPFGSKDWNIKSCSSHKKTFSCMIKWF